MSLFFDLSIPFLESGAPGAASSSDPKACKAARLKAVVRAMELGYAGVAYDRPFRGVVSDAERCQIPPFPLSSLLKVAPALAASASFHRDLVGSPLSVPFRQYTRITVSAAGGPAVLALNGCHVLRTYDLVAVRPLSQDAFEKACEASQVNIISLDISQKLPYRLKLPLIKLAIQRGLYFEITYSYLIGDVHVRRQILTDVKLLAEWTRGKNLIISSAAANVNDVRGPHDVINLAAYLLGLSLERARACISRNCRVLVADALKKKQFHKEAIKVERIAPSEQLNSKRFWIGDWNNYDPMSSGEGDLPSLDDISKSFSSSSKPSVHLNSIDFTLLTNKAPFILGQKAAIISSPKKIRQPAASGDAQYVSDDAKHYDIPVRNNNLIMFSPLEHEKSSCEDATVSGSDVQMLLAETKYSGLVAESDEKIKGFDVSALASEAVPNSSPKGCEPQCEIPSANVDSTPEVNHCLDPLVVIPLEQTKSAYEDFPSSGYATLITESRKSGVVEVDGSQKTSVQCALTSDRIAKPSCDTKSRACNPKVVGEHAFLSLSSTPVVLSAIENKQVSDIVMEDHESSHLSNKSQIKMSKDIADPMNGTPMTAHDRMLQEDDHLPFASLIDKNIPQEQVELNALEQDQKDEMMIDDTTLEQVFLHPHLNKKGSIVTSAVLDVAEDGFLEAKVQEGETLLFENNSSFGEGEVVLKEDIIKSHLNIEAALSETRSENDRSSDIEMEDHENSNILDKPENMVSKIITETIECAPSTADDQILPIGGDSSFTSLLEENVQPKQIDLEILEQEQNKNMIDHETLQEKILLHPQVNNKRRTVTSSVQDVMDDAFVETKMLDGETHPFVETKLDESMGPSSFTLSVKEQDRETLLPENDSLKEGMVMLKEDITKMPLITEAETCKTKSGSHKGRLLRPAHPLPFKSLFKPMLYRKKLQKSSRRSKMS